MAELAWLRREGFLARPSPAAATSAFAALAGNAVVSGGGDGALAVRVTGTSFIPRREVRGAGAFAPPASRPSILFSPHARSVAWRFVLSVCSRAALSAAGVAGHGGAAARQRRRRHASTGVCAAAPLVRRAPPRTARQRRRHPPRRELRRRRRGGLRGGAGVLGGCAGGGRGGSGGGAAAPGRGGRAGAAGGARRGAAGQRGAGRILARGAHHGEAVPALSDWAVLAAASRGLQGGGTVAGAAAELCAWAARQRRRRRRRRGGPGSAVLAGHVVGAARRGRGAGDAAVLLRWRRCWAGRPRCRCVHPASTDGPPDVSGWKDQQRGRSQAPAQAKRRGWAGAKGLSRRRRALACPTRAGGGGGGAGPWLPCHRVVLAAASPVLRAMLTSGMREHGAARLTLQGAEPEVRGAALRSSGHAVARQQGSAAARKLGIRQTRCAAPPYAPVGTP